MMLSRTLLYFACFTFTLVLCKPNLVNMQRDVTAEKRLKHVNDPIKNEHSEKNLIQKERDDDSKDIDIAGSSKKISKSADDIIKFNKSLIESDLKKGTNADSEPLSPRCGLGIINAGLGLLKGILGGITQPEYPTPPPKQKCEPDVRQPFSTSCIDTVCQQNPCNTPDCKPKPCKTCDCKPKPCKTSKCKRKRCRNPDCKPKPCKNSGCKPKPYKNNRC
uniref:Uncharacterized protein n=1 Tax=Cuerna arida TaxID=1464854 RepID=A0A1B6G558_9HEMI